MEQDTLSQALDKLDAALGNALGELKQHGAAAFSQGNFDLAGNYADAAKQLEGIRAQVVPIGKKLTTAIASKSVPQNQTAPVSTPMAPPLSTTIAANQQSPTAPAAHAHSSAKHLRVIFEGGRVIEENTAAQTFVEVLAVMGLERVAQLGKKLSGAPLVSTDESVYKYQGHTRTGGWYVCTHSNTKKKKELLEEIADRLHVKIGVTLIN